MLKAFKTKKFNRYLTIFLAILIVLLWGAAFSFPDKRLRVVFCDVGQGDAILITQGFTQVLVDGGPNDRVLACLTKNMPFFDKTIEVVILTHPDFDHVSGLNSVWDKYRVKYFFSGPEGSASAAYLSLLEKIEKDTSVQVINPYAGQRIKIGDMVWESWWPEKTWLASRVNYESGTMSHGQGGVLGANTEHKNLNDFSLVFLLRYHNLKILLMGDADSRVQGEIARANNLFPVNLLKFPHHGSKTGLREDFLEKIKPKVAVISVGKNSYGHPAQEALDMLKQYGVKVRRTDLEGNIKYEF